MSKSREQTLIDTAFAIAYHVKHYHSDKMTTEETMSWVAEQLRSMGFDTEPRGVSWGILKENSELQSNSLQEQSELSEAIGHAIRARISEHQKRWKRMY